MSVVNVVNHGNCRDGFTAAWAFYKNLSKNYPTGTVVNFLFESHKYPQTLKLLDKKTIGQEEVIFLDICPKRGLLEQLHAVAGSTQVYDHHQTAAEDCGDLPYCYFDMDRSGAGIAWDVFSKGAKRPFLVDCVEDGDIWKWVVPDSKFVLIVLEGERLNFENWNAFNDKLEAPAGRGAIITKGKSYDEYRRRVSSMLLAGKVHKLTFKTGHTLPAVNASIFQSGLGNAITNRPGPAAAVYFTRGKGWAFSLRSNDEGPDVAKIAETYGGGGHRNAAGFKVDNLTDLTMSEYTEEELEQIETELGIRELTASDCAYHL